MPLLKFQPSYNLKDGNIWILAYSLGLDQRPVCCHFHNHLFAASWVWEVKWNVNIFHIKSSYRKYYSSLQLYANNAMKCSHSSWRLQNLCQLSHCTYCSALRYDMTTSQWAKYYVPKYKHHEEVFALINCQYKNQRMLNYCVSCDIHI